jgi:hypothetical protein
MAITWKGSKENIGSDSPAKQEILSPGTPSMSDLVSNESAKDFVSDAREKMSFLARWNFDRQTQASLQRVAGEIAVNYLNGHKKLLISKISTGVALGTRQNLEEFLLAAVGQDKNLLALTNSAQKEMSNMIEDDVVVVLKEKKIRFDKADSDLKNGEILQEDHEALKDVHTQVAAKLINDKFDRMNKIAESYTEKFDEALEQYKERAIEAGITQLLPSRRSPSA